MVDPSLKERLDLSGESAGFTAGEFVAASIIGLTFSLTVGSILAAMFHQHHLPAVLVIAGATWGAFLRLLPRPSRAAGSIGRAVSFVLIALVATSVLANLAMASELVFTGRDGATYSNEARSLIDGVSLLPLAIEAPFLDVDQLTYDAPGFVLRSDGRLYQQFLHAVPAFQATLGEAFGERAIFWAGPLLGGVGLLAFFFLALQYTTPWPALWATGLISISLPFVYYARSTFSEPAAFAFAMGGLWMVTVAIRHRDVSAAIPAGLLLGAVALVRVDGWMIAAGVALFDIALVVVDEPGESNRKSREATRRILLWFYAVAGAGVIDLLFYGRPYLSILGNRFTLLLGTVLILRVLTGLLESRFGSRRSVWRISRSFASFTVAGFLGAALIVLWFIRPLLGQSVGSPYGLEVIQARAGLPLESDRTYSELSLWWLSWYLGFPIVIAGWVATIAAATRSIRAEVDFRTLGAIVLLIPGLAYSIWPSVNPDHPWAIRRFLPIVIPGLVLGAAWMVGKSAAVVGSRSGGRALVAGAACLVVLPAILVTAPFAGHAEGAPSQAIINAGCESLHPVDAVVVVDDTDIRLSHAIAQPLRAWCGIPVAAVDTAHLRSVLPPITRNLRMGASLAVLSTNRFLMEDEPIVVLSGEPTVISETLTAAPSELRGLDVKVFGWFITNEASHLDDA